MKILFVEDDDIIASGLIYALEADGYTVTHCSGAFAAYEQISRLNFDIAVLDLSIPDGSGFDICKRLKESSSTPVIFLTAADDEGNTVKGLEMGADDYITKPFRILELKARIKAVLRRANVKTDKRKNEMLCLGGIKILISQGKVFRGEEEIILTALEYKLLLTFAGHKGQVLSRSQILEAIWDEEGNFVNDNTLSVYIKRLREKLGDDQQAHRIIQTVRGLGYRVGE